jgi:hypothetical protein
MKKINLEANVILLISLSTILYLLFGHPNAIYELGGSVILLITISGLVLFSLLKKNLASELSFITFIITGLIILNYFGYQEVSGMKLRFEYALIFILCVALTLVFIMAAFIKLLKPDTAVNNNRRFKNELAIILAAPMFISTTFIVVVLSTFSLAQEENILSRNPIHRYTDMALFFIIAGLIVSLIYLSKIKDDAIKQVFREEKYHSIRFDSRKVGKYLKLVLILSFLLGSIIEMNRGLWILWIETNIAMALISMILWKAYKHVFYKSEVPPPL